MTTNEHKETIGRIRANLTDVFGILDELSQNSTNMHDVEIRAVLATRDALNGVDGELQKLEREL